MRSQDWATRIGHEAKYHECTSFITLTYSDANLPENYSISIRSMQLFLKRLRKKCGSFRFFACGEYGEINLRPHYHIILFGLDFASDRVPWRTSPSGFVTYRSPTLETLWPYGFSEIGTVSVQSAGYVARYCLKKVTGDNAKQHYLRAHPLTGEINAVHPEFITMSTKPGIGNSWIKDFHTDLDAADFVILDGKKRPVPRYYLKQLSEDARTDIVHARAEKAKPHAANNTPERLATREESQILKAQRLHRQLDNES